MFSDNNAIGTASFEQLRNIVSLIENMDSVNDIDYIIASFEKMIKEVYNNPDKDWEQSDNYNIRHILDMIHCCFMRNLKKGKLYQTLMEKFVEKYPTLNYSYNHTYKNKFVKKVELNEVEQAVKDDDVDKLQQLMVNKDLNAQIYKHDIPTLDDNHIQRSLVELAMMYGSVRCFKYLFLNGCYDKYAWHVLCESYRFVGIKEILIGGNYEILHIIEQQHSNYSSLTPFGNDEVLVIRGTPEILQYLINKYDIETKQDNNFAGLVYSAINYYNYNFLAYLFDNYREKFISYMGFGYDNLNENNIERKMLLYVIRRRFEVYPLIKLMITYTKTLSLIDAAEYPSHLIYLLKNTGIIENNKPVEIVENMVEYFGCGITNEVKKVMNWEHVKLHSY